MNPSKLLFGVYLILAPLLFYGIFYSPGGLKEYLAHKRKYLELETQIKKIQAENHDLLLKINNFKKNRPFREFIVRNKLGWIKDGEKIIILDTHIKEKGLEVSNESR